MSIEASLFTYLTASATGVKALIGSRLYAGVAADGAAMPYAVYQRLTSERVQSLGGSSDLVSARFQITCLATTNAAALGVATAIRKAINDYRGAMGSTPVQAITLVGESDLPAIAPQDATRRTYGRYLDFEIWYEE